MNFISLHTPQLKSLFLSSVSLHVIQIGYGVMPEFEWVENENVYAYDSQGGSIWTFLVWIRLWLNWLCGEQFEPFNEHVQRQPNRHNRRMERRTIPCARNLVPYYSLLAKGIYGQKLSPTQFLERLCRLSVFGRIRLYRMRQSGSVLQRRALLICYDHGWWRAPIGDFGRLYCGVWPIFIWVNWHLLPDWFSKSDFKF